MVVYCAGCVRQWFRTAEPLGERRYENWITHTHSVSFLRGEPGLVDRVVALHTGSRGFDSHRGHMSDRFFRSRQGYPHPVSFELENSGIRVAVGDCSVTERRRWRPPTFASKTLHTQRGWTHGAGCVRQWFRTADPLGERRYENWNTHTRTHARTHAVCHFVS